MVAQTLLDIKKELVESISNPSGLLVDSMRSAVKKPAMKKSRNPAKFPEDQRATQEQLHLECCPIPPKLNEMLLELQQQTGAMDRFVVGAAQREGLNLSYPVWKQIRCSVGKAVKRIRSADPNCQQPLLWSHGAPDAGETVPQRWGWERDPLPSHGEMIFTSTNSDCNTAILDRVPYFSWLPSVNENIWGPGKIMQHPYFPTK